VADEHVIGMVAGDADASDTVVAGCYRGRTETDTLR